MTKFPIAPEADMPEDGGDKPLDSHVQEPPPVYGEPKGPRPGTMFRHPSPLAPLPDRERHGFISGPDALGLGDIVGSGPEELQRQQPAPATHKDRRRDE